MSGTCERPASRATVLVTDDNVAVRRVTREILEDSGYRVVEAANGQEAAEQLRLETIDLLVTDLIMPDQDGIETIIEVTREFPGLRILAMSGSSQDYLEAATLLGAHATLRKPFKVEELRKVVAELLAAQHLDHNSSNLPA